MSARMASTVARTFESSAARKAASRPRLRYRAICAAPKCGLEVDRKGLLDGLRVDRRAGTARQVQRRRGEKEFVDLVAVAILGEFLQIEDLPHRNADRGDHHPVPWLVGVPGLVRTHLASPGIRTDRRNVLFADPVTRLEGK